jgi:hypothetical protein
MGGICSTRGEMRNSYKFVIVKPQEERPHEDVVKLDLTN